MSKKKYEKPTITHLEAKNDPACGGSTCGGSFTAPIGRMPDFSDPPDWNGVRRALFDALSIPAEYLGENPGALNLVPGCPLTVEIPAFVTVGPNANGDVFPALEGFIGAEIWEHVDKPDEGQAGRIPGDDESHVWVTNENGDHETLCGIVAPVVFVDLISPACPRCKVEARNDTRDDPSFQ